MGQFADSAEALIEILNLCEQTLTALTPVYDNAGRYPQSDEVRRQERHHGAKFVSRLFLIRGGRYHTDQQP